MSERFRIRVVKDHLTFCSAHFISYQGDKCERLHGHNYRTAVEVEGPLDENFYVFDFIALKDLTRSITDRLDHRMLLPTKNPHIHVQRTDAVVTVHYRDRSWQFPAEECVLLPIENTTAELLARHIADQLRTALRQQWNFSPDLLRVEVEEGPGQSAVYEWRAN